MKSKQTFQFTLILKNVDENTLNVEDSLYEAGCDDALVNFRSGAVYLEFDRKSISFEEAVITAIKDVMSAPFNAEIASVAPENLVTESEIAERLGKTRQTVSLWTNGKRKKSFPKPIMHLTKKSPLWSWSEVVVWLYDNKIIEDKRLVETALFISNINGALEDRNNRTNKIRKNLLKKINSHDSSRNIFRGI